MNKKTYIVLILIIPMLIVSSINVSAHDGTLTITDEINDIIKVEGGTVTFNISYPDIDFKTLSFKQNGKQVNVTMKLATGGEFQENLVTAYVIILLTTSYYGEYEIFYSGELTVELGYPLFVRNGIGELKSIKDYTGKGTDTLQFSFDLIDKNERLIDTLVLTTEDEVYYDFYPQNFYNIENISDVADIKIDAGGPYDTKKGQRIRLSGRFISGEITYEHEWFWTFDDSNITLEGKNPSYVFDEPKIYTGKLYIYDGNGSWGMDTFEVNVTKSKSYTGTLQLFFEKLLKRFPFFEKILNQYYN